MILTVSRKEGVRIGKQDLRNAWPLHTMVKDMKQRQLEDADLAVIMKWLKEGIWPFGSVVQAAGQ